MTAQTLGLGTIVWKRLFQFSCCLLVGWTCFVLVAGFLAKLITVMFVTIFGAPVALALLLIAAISWRCWKTKPRRWYRMVLLLASPLLVATVLFTNWPMRLSFAVSQPALDRFADQVAAGHTSTLPKRVGPYTILAVQTEPVKGAQAICLWTTSPKRGHIGFVRRPVGTFRRLTRGRIPVWVTTGTISARTDHFTSAPAAPVRSQKIVTQGRLAV
jgi:hypothetical protein